VGAVAERLGREVLVLAIRTIDSDHALANAQALARKHAEAVAKLPSIDRVLAAAYLVGDSGGLLVGKKELLS
jgi:hypothetical protein